jgi:hypothetical protein
VPRGQGYGSDRLDPALSPLATAGRVLVGLGAGASVCVAAAELGRPVADALHDLVAPLGGCTIALRQARAEATLPAGGGLPSLTHRAVVMLTEPLADCPHHAFAQCLGDLAALTLWTCSATPARVDAALAFLGSLLALETLGGLALPLPSALCLTLHLAHPLGAKATKTLDLLGTQLSAWALRPRTGSTIGLPARLSINSISAPGRLRTLSRTAALGWSLPASCPRGAITLVASQSGPAVRALGGGRLRPGCCVARLLSGLRATIILTRAGSIGLGTRADCEARDRYDAHRSHHVAGGTHGCTPCWFVIECALTEYNDGPRRGLLHRTKPLHSGAALGDFCRVRRVQIIDLTVAV